ncbi:MAG TPA: CRTAC1 family protein [Chthonomonadaceae bacterium]|nr:CRTAC1 family protein [Chthonomonadaceae bacterium]
MVTRREWLQQTGKRLLLSGLGLPAVELIAGCRAATTPRKASPEAASRPIPHFSDVTEAAGLAFSQSDGGCGLQYFVEQIAAGAALLDANGDGLLDIYFPQPRPLGACTSKTSQTPSHRLYLNDGKGRFTLSPHAFGGAKTDYGIAAAVGDYNNDGHPDLYVACYGRNSLFRNRGDGTFEDVTETAGVGVTGLSSGAVWFDYDGDGRLDLYVIRYVEWTVESDIACLAVNGRRDACHPTTYPAATNILYHNNGDGTFTDVTRQAGLAGDAFRSLAVAAVDFDGDGRLDLFVANDQQANNLYRNLGSGRFEDVALQENVAFGENGRAQANMGIAVGDYDGDGDLDFALSTFATEPRTLYRNDGATFSDVSNATGVGPVTRRYLAFGTGFLDTRNDGRLDLFFANGHISPWAYLKDSSQTFKEPNQLLLNTGQGHFTDTPSALPADDVRVHRGACFGDIDNDGRVDILVTAQNDRPALLHNDTPAGNWLLLKLTDKHGCGTPIGAKCIAIVQGRKLLRVVLGGGSYGGESDHRVHFGLGAARQVDKLEIHWLSGTVQTLTNLPVNQILSLREPSR